ncbi:hypothetical protein [Haliea sp. E17]|uniref:hypothetical protein n=1 Tax=Haliea sp. E17 TaxID=3401576 RepID=UPI003AAE7FB5
MKYLIILFVVALALAPLTHFLPSKRQRQLARLREYAAVHGLFVEFRNLPGAREGERAEQVIYYGKRLPASRGEPRRQRAWIGGAGHWRGAGHRDPVPTATEGFPAQILACSEDEGSCGAYWKEDGEEADVAAIVAALEAWSGVEKAA